jgi:hypothetical protein
LPVSGIAETSGRCPALLASSDDHGAVCCPVGTMTWAILNGDAAPRVITQHTGTNGTLLDPHRVSWVGTLRGFSAFFRMHHVCQVVYGTISRQVPRRMPYAPPWQSSRWESCWS